MLFNAKVHGIDTYFLADTEEHVKEFGSKVEKVQPVEDMKAWEIPDDCKLYLLDLDAVIDMARHVYIDAHDNPVWPWPKQGSRFHLWQPNGYDFEKFSGYPPYTDDSVLDHGDVILSKDNVVIVSYRP